jgi:hypothetical protein
VLIAVTVVAAALGGREAWRRRRWPILLYAAAALLAGGVVYALGSHWVDAKALAIVSPALVVLALVGAASLVLSGRRVEGAIVGLAVACGLLWSNALAYSEVNLAPKERLAELEEIGRRFVGEGPTHMPEYEPYGARYLLRDADPEGAGELRRRPVRLRNGGTVRKGATADLDEFQLGEVLTYRTLVLRRSPTASRPPSPYRMVWRGRFYEVWQRPEGAAGGVEEHLPLGDGLQAAALPPSQAVRRLSARAESGRRVSRSPARPRSWPT